ncbi:hypothetical protein C0992_007314, partial [Termitomyces sp. T32_za158]
SKPTENSSDVGKDAGTREDKTVFVDQKAAMSKHILNPKKKSQKKSPDATGAPYMQASSSPSLSTMPITPKKRTAMPHRLEREHFELRGSAMYFTVDPNWDASKEEAADLFLMPNVPTGVSPGKVRQKVTTTVAVSSARNNQRGRSFLTLE